MENYNAQNPPTQQHRQQAREVNLYRAQVHRARRPPQPARRPSIIINGENLTAKQTLDRFPQLRGFLQGRKQILEKSLPRKSKNVV